MKYALIIPILFLSAATFGQQYDSTKRLQVMNGDGLSIRNVQIRDSGSIRVPRSAINMAFRDSGAVAYRNGQLIVWNGTQWVNSGSATDTTGIRLQATAGPGISISGTYPNLTFAGNPDTLSATDPLQLTQVSTKRLRLDFRRDWLDSLLALQVDSSGLLDSALLRNDSLFTYSGGVESYRGKVSGGGGGTLQEAFDAAPTSIPQINAKGNQFTIDSVGQNSRVRSDYPTGSGKYAEYGFTSGTPYWVYSYFGGTNIVTTQPDGLYSVGNDTLGNGYEFYAGAKEILWGTTANTKNSVIRGDSSKLTLFTGYNEGENPSDYRLGINTTTPTATIHIVSHDSDALRIVAPFSNTELSTDSALVIGTDGNVKKAAKASGGSGITTAQLTDSLNNREPRYKFRDDSTGNAGYTTLYQNSLKADTFNQTFTGRNTFTSTTSGLIIPRVTTAQMNAISGPTNGEMVYNTDEGATYYYTTDWGWMSDAPEWKRRNGIEQFSEFISQPTAINMQTDFFTTVLANSGTIGSATAVSNRPGIYKLSTSTSSNARSSLIADPTNATNILLGGGQLMYETDVQIPTLSNSSETFRFFVGLSANTQVASVTGVAFLYDSSGVTTGSAASGNWQVVCANASSCSYTTTTVPVVAGQWYRLKAVVNAAATSVQFYIDGTLVRTETSNIPTTGVTPAVVLTKSNGTTARTALIDWFFLKQKFTTQR